MKISELEKHDVESMIIMLYDQYNMHIGRKVDETLRNGTIESIIRYVSEHKNSLSISHIEDVFNVAVFESKYAMTYAMFIERVKALIKENNEKNINNTRNTKHVDWASVVNSEENKRRVQESIKAGRVLDSKNVYYTLDELKLVDRELYDSIKRLGDPKTFNNEKFKTKR